MFLAPPLAQAPQVPWSLQLQILCCSNIFKEFLRISDSMLFRVDTELVGLKIFVGAVGGEKGDIKKRGALKKKSDVSFSEETTKFCSHTRSRHPHEAMIALVFRQPTKQLGKRCEAQLQAQVTASSWGTQSGPKGDIAFRMVT